LLDPSEYIEQAYFFKSLNERLPENMPIQELLAALRDEVLATSKLPMALDFLLTELRHQGVMAPAMKKLSHYFTGFQIYLIEEAEAERGRFDMRIAVALLERESEYKAKGATNQGLFLYQFETICRNRLQYDAGLAAVAKDPQYDELWRDWILEVRKQIGVFQLPDMIYVRSAYYPIQQKLAGKEDDSKLPHLFGEGEGRIALANRKKDPLYLFSALQRHLGYPASPKPKKADLTKETIDQILRRLERMETRLKLMEDENREGTIDLERFYEKPPKFEDLDM